MARTEIKIGIKIISELKSFVSLIVQNEPLLNNFRKSEKDFTRNRKLPFERLVLLIVKLCKKTLSIELEKFFEELGGQSPCSVSAFTQQRIKLKASFFYWWNNVLLSSYYHHAKQGDIKRWKGFRVVSADGSNVSLVNTPVLSNYFGGASNQSGCFVQAKTFYHYDVLNELVLMSRIMPYRYGEVPMAYDAIEQLKKDMLVIYDRNFCSYKMFALHLWAEEEIKFVIRGKNDQNMIKDFIAGGKHTAIVYLAPVTTAIKSLKESGFITTNKTLLKLRLVRVELENAVEVLVTNLWEEEGYPNSEFKALYFLRWGVETNISIQKNILQLEAFSGLTVESVEQDFYATVFMTNLHAVLIKDAQASVDNNLINRKYPMKVNKNKSFGKLKINLVAIFNDNNADHILEVLHKHFIRDILPVRKDRTFPRVRKNRQTNSKHRTYSNFKPAY
ncbi:IS4 family transposase [Mucilaginibacter sp. cycad4]|uniref:IS4 family transposase n=1 Tax=Mucilaginibacter sp. cycad4 TaxID=3342096 RepID=UPI002AAC06AE|nr:IS4 family transposase [Mucilaginibacter gossypii]WPU98265.1 IS4 family transposase [Mucilaginibacter gossypii]WPU99821.1 IS4 family transposase [Mucilaginibacter gossypii]WPV00126.1 IS4 family transposase [Mucilaginibacter gossypii]